VPRRARAEPSDADFLAARSAFERGDRARLKALAPSVAGHVLEPYVAYWERKLSLDTAGAEEIGRYLTRCRTPRSRTGSGSNG